MNWIPSKLKALAKLVDPEPGRWPGMAGVYLTFEAGQKTRGPNEPPEADRFIVAATDSKFAAIVSGPCPEAFQPMIDQASAALATDRSEAIDACLNAAAFKNALGDCGGSVQTRNAAVRLIDGGAAIYATDGKEPVAHAVHPVEGKFPPVGEIFPTGKPIASLMFNPLRLVELLRVAALFAADPDDGLNAEPRVVISFFGYDKPSVVTATDGRNDFVGLLMPFGQVQGDLHINRPLLARLSKAIKAGNVERDRAANSRDKALAAADGK